ncbi:MAG: hypothetical protein SXA11_06895 [Cyanobacteriota bacterium]|nr:hypothetical protein [Cyanobacteriota bacterium]
MQKQPHFSQLTLAALLGALSALIIVGGTLGLLFPGGTVGPYQERGSGRNKVIIGTEDAETEKEPPKRRQKTEVAASTEE